MRVRKTVPLLLAAVMLCSCSSLNRDDDNAEPVLLTGVSAEMTEETAEIISPEGAVVLSPAAAEIICELGFSDKIAARGEYCDYPEELLSIPTAGSAANPDVTKILEYSPDIVITESPISKADRTDLMTGGAEVLSLTSPDSLASLREEYITIASLWSDTPEELADNALAELVRASEEAPQIDGRLMLFLSEENVATPDTLSGDLIGTFGANAAKGYKNYYMPYDKIIMTDPDVIFLSDNVDYYTFTEAYSELTAVKNGNIIIIDGSFLERPTSRLSELMDFISDNIPLLKQSDADLSEDE
ncbi:MAG: ABC transporter substrate-binding protein [Oscillospiraceae bacterium]